MRLRKSLIHDTLLFSLGIISFSIEYRGGSKTDTSVVIIHRTFLEYLFSLRIFKRNLLESKNNWTVRMRGIVCF